MNYWTVLGFCGQALFSGRFLLQWIVSERRGASVIPLGFWFFSLGGATLLLMYAIHIRDLVFILGQSVGFLVYIRNLVLIFRKRAGSLDITEKPT